MLKGKKCEGKIKEWLKECDIYHHRFLDSMSCRGFAPNQPADFWCYYKRKLILIECKETESDKIRFTAFRPSQLKAMMEAVKYGYSYLVVVMHRKKNIYFINGHMLIMLIESGKKSFSYQSYGREIESKEKMREYFCLQ